MLSDVAAQFLRSLPVRLHPCIPALLVLLFGLSPVLECQQPATVPDAHAQAAAAALMTLYNRDTGLFRTTGWWNSANAITALTDEGRLTGDRAVRPVLKNTLRKAPHKFPHFLNEFYDDEGWWALAWIDSYDLTGKKQYLRASEVIFTDMTGGWSETCGGGIWWKKNSHYKNAIANELFLAVAAELALREHGEEQAQDLDWANREWAWFSQSGMINAQGLVNDGLRLDPDGSCHNNGRTTWSYNQGVVLGGLAALSRAAKKPELLAPANRIAGAAIEHLTDSNGILHDPCEPDCGADGVQFKGIFARNLAQLQAAAPQATYVQFLTTNADVLWRDARTPGNRFSTVWSGPPVAGNAGAQASALDLLNAAAAVSGKAGMRERP